MIICHQWCHLHFSSCLFCWIPCEFWISSCITKGSRQCSNGQILSDILCEHLKFSIGGFNDKVWKRFSICTMWKESQKFSYICKRQECIGNRTVWCLIVHSWIEFKCVAIICDSSCLNTITHEFTFCRDSCSKAYLALSRFACLQKPQAQNPIPASKCCRARWRIYVPCSWVTGLELEKKLWDLGQQRNAQHPTTACYIGFAVVLYDFVVITSNRLKPHRTITLKFCFTLPFVALVHIPTKECPNSLELAIFAFTFLYIVYLKLKIFYSCFHSHQLFISLKIVPRDQWM